MEIITGNFDLYWYYFRNIIQWMSLVSLTLAIPDFSQAQELEVGTDQKTHFSSQFTSWAAPKLNPESNPEPIKHAQTKLVR